MELLTLFSIHPAAAGPAFVPQNHGLHHPLLPLGQSHPPGALGLEVARGTSPKEGVSIPWPDLALHQLPAHHWAEGRERKGTRLQRDPAPEEDGMVLGTGTQIQDSRSCCDGVVTLLPPPPSPHQCLLQRDILCTQKPFQAWDLPLWGS